MAVAQPSTLIYFIHGLAGSPSRTWNDFHGTLKKDSELLSVADVAFFSFPSPKIRLPFGPKSLLIQELARAVDSDLRVKYAKYDRVVAVAYSLGGLVLKRYVIGKLKEREVLRVKSAVFFAVPHMGSDWAIIANVFSWRNKQLSQLNRGSETVTQLTEDWQALDCESHLSAVYVVAGQDGAVDRASASGPLGARVELLPDRNHHDVIRPSGLDDLAYLVVKQQVIASAYAGNTALQELSGAIYNKDEGGVATILANVGRSIIETEQLPQIAALLTQVERDFPRESAAVVWSKYLLIISSLFQTRKAGGRAIDAQLLSDAGRYGLDAVFMAERIELARKNGDLEKATEFATELSAKLQNQEEPKDAGNAYAVATAHYLLANFLRGGGRYDLARNEIELAKGIFRPAIASHQTELAHCEYGLALCNAMTGGAAPQSAIDIGLSPELRQFSEGLLTLVRAHTAWRLGQLAEADEQASSASRIFGRIGYTAYANRAALLKNLVEVWRQLQFGAKPHQIQMWNGSEYGPLNGWMGDSSEVTELATWIAEARPSRVLGMLQFASAFNPDWTKESALFRLPPVLSMTEDGLEWTSRECRSLKDIDTAMRELMHVPHGRKVPLLAQ